MIHGASYSIQYEQEQRRHCDHNQGWTVTEFGLDKVFIPIAMPRSPSRKHQRGYANFFAKR
jgi:hypothetical protein